MSAPNFTITGPPLPLHETRTTVRTPGEEYNQLVPQQLENLDEQRKNEEQQVADTKVQIGREKDIAKADAAIAQEQANEQGRQMAFREKRAAEADKAVGVWRNRLEGAYNAAMSAPTPSLWANKNTGGEVMRTIGSLFLGALADASSASVASMQGRAPGPSTVDQIIERDLNEQRANIERLKDNVVTARTGVKDAEEARRLMLAEVDAKGAAIYKRLEAIGKARLAALKVDQTTIDNDPRIAEIRQKGIAYRGNSVAGLYEKFQKPTTDVENVVRDDPQANKVDKPTERQSTDAFLGQQMLDEFKTIDKLPMLDAAALAKLQNNELQSNAADQSTILGSKQAGAAATSFLRDQGLVPRSKYDGLTPKQQQVANAIDNLADKFARKLTGAGMPETEAVRSAQELKPRAGDSPQIINDKLARLRAAANQNMALSGPAGPMAASAARGTTPVPAGDSTAAGGAVHGTRDTRRDADAQPSYSPAGPAIETKANNPDDPNSSAALPEPPDAASIDDYQKPAPKGRGQLPYAPSGKSTAQLPPAAAAPGAPPSVREKAIAFLKAHPAVRATKSAKALMKQQHITEADLGR